MFGYFVIHILFLCKDRGKFHILLSASYITLSFKFMYIFLYKYLKLIIPNTGCHLYSYKPNNKMNWRKQLNSQKDSGVPGAKEQRIVGKTRWSKMHQYFQEGGDTLPVTIFVKSLHAFIQDLLFFSFCKQKAI